MRTWEHSQVLNIKVRQVENKQHDGSLIFTAPPQSMPNNRYWDTIYKGLTKNLKQLKVFSHFKNQKVKRAKESEEYGTSLEGHPSFQSIHHQLLTLKIHQRLK